MYCTKCGNPNPDDAAFCNKCGSSVSPTQPSQPLANPPISKAVPAPVPVSAKKGPSCWLVGCLVVVAVFVLLAIVSALTSNGTHSTISSSESTGTPYSGGGWYHKAIANENEASKLVVGGFSVDDARLYHAGLQHIAKLHQRVGSFTIGDVVNQQRAREQQAQEQVAQAAQERQAAEESHFYHGTPDCLVLDNRTLGTESDEYTWYIIGKVTNRCDKDLGYVQIEIAFLDSGGNLVNSGIENVNNLAAGQTWSFKKPVYENTGGKWRIEGLTGY